MKKKILMLISLICIIGGIRADYNYHTPIQGESYLNSYLEIPFTNEANISQNGYFENGNDFVPLMKISETPNGDFEGDPSGPGVGEDDIPISDGLLVFFSFACLYVFWKLSNRHFRRLRLFSN